MPASGDWPRDARGTPGAWRATAGVLRSDTMVPEAATARQRSTAARHAALAARRPDARGILMASGAAAPSGGKERP
jgi:hypothetical protein